MTPRHTHPWEYPDCPECETDVFVVGWSRNPRGNQNAPEVDDYKCEFCGTTFDAPEGEI